MPPILYFLIQRTDHGYSVLHKFDSAERRDDKTIELIFGHKLEDQNEAEEWDHLRAQLNDRAA